MSRDVGFGEKEVTTQMCSRLAIRKLERCGVTSVFDVVHGVRTLSMWVAGAVFMAMVGTP